MISSNCYTKKKRSYKAENMWFMQRQEKMQWSALFYLVCGLSAFSGGRSREDVKICRPFYSSSPDLHGFQRAIEIWKPQNNKWGLWLCLERWGENRLGGLFLALVPVILVLISLIVFQVGYLRIRRKGKSRQKHVCLRPRTHTEHGLVNALLACIVWVECSSKPFSTWEWMPFHPFTHGCVATLKMSSLKQSVNRTKAKKRMSSDSIERPHRCSSRSAWSSINSMSSVCPTFLKSSVYWSQSSMCSCLTDLYPFRDKKKTIKHLLQPVVSFLGIIKL